MDEDAPNDSTIDGLACNYPTPKSVDEDEAAPDDVRGDAPDTSFRRPYRRYPLTPSSPRHEDAQRVEHYRKTDHSEPSEHRDARLDAAKTLVNFSLKAVVFERQ